jgi:hypothetical protein
MQTLNVRVRGRPSRPLVPLLLGLALALPCPALAGIVSVTGDGDILVPGVHPTGATANFFNNPAATAKVHGWNERQSVVLTQDVFVDITSDGLYNANGDLGTFNQFKLASGTAVSSHLLYFDPLGGSQVESVTFTFDNTILGVIVESDRFQRSQGVDYFRSSDFLGNPFTVYPGSHFNNRGLELGADSISVSMVGRTVTIEHYSASSPGDQIRVITAANPEPASLTLAGLGALVLAGYRLRRRRA